MVVLEKVLLCPCELGGEIFGREMTNLATADRIKGSLNCCSVVGSSVNTSRTSGSCE